MESCRKKVVLEAGLRVLGDAERAAGSRWARLEEIIVLRGLDLGQMGVCYQPPGGQKTNSGSKMVLSQQEQNKEGSRAEELSETEGALAI